MVIDTFSLKAKLLTDKLKTPLDGFGNISAPFYNVKLATAVGITTV